MKRKAKIEMPSPNKSLFKLMTSSFNEEELKTLCFYLDVEYDALTGEGKEGKLRELILFFRRKDRIDEFVYEVGELRPHLKDKLSDLQKDHEEPLESDDTVADQSDLPEQDDYSKVEEIIKRHCQEKWGDDFRMRVYCESKQREALATLNRSTPLDIPLDAFKGIRDDCAAKWPDNYRMRLYCEEKQVEAYRQLNNE